ncbi:hypothetical protein [Hymenobacter sp.]|uniref:hypothetical protein n=1 Tax=Hymenobacter sp. TaxID=1898978 RepID=UPI00286BE0D1|nr:hypothetical protein [Hymenobacter sp.]
MSSKLSQLLAYYEAERNRLVALVADCVAESEHKLAHHHAKALRLVNRKLQTFRNLADPLYDQKQSRLRHIGAIKELMATKAPEIPRSFFLETLRQAQQQLEELN